MSGVIAIIVPTMVGLGLLVSVLVLLWDAWQRLQGPGWMSRRCGRQGRVSAGLAAARGSDELPRHELGLRSRPWYLVTGVLASVVSVWAVAGSWGNYIGWTDWLESIAWLWVLFLAVGILVGIIAVASFVLATHSLRPAWVEPLLARTPLGRPPTRPSVATTVVAHPRHVRRAHPPTIAVVRPLGRHHVTDTVAGVARLVAAVWVLVAVSALGWLTLRGQIPASPEELDAGIAGPAWVTLYVLIVVASIAVHRFEVLGSIALAVLAGLLALLSSIQYQPWVAALLAVVFAVPAFLHWLAWQRDHHVHHLVRVAALAFVAVAALTIGADRVYAHYFGPTHPDSVVDLAAQQDVEWAWVGATTSEATSIVVRTVEPADRVRVAIGTSPDLGNAKWSEPNTSTEARDRVVRLDVGGLQPGMLYFWAVEVDGRLDDSRKGRFRTMPEGASSFSLAVGSCARSGSNAAVFDTIRRRDPLAFLVLGDLHYANIGTDDPERFRGALDQLLSTPGPSALYRSTTTAYVWDDHDYSDNDGDSTSPSRPAAGEVYRSWVPHYPLVSDEPEGPIGQSFVAGRVRVLLTDTRSQRSPPGTATGADQHVLGRAQEAWLAGQLGEARDAGQIVIWANSSPWIGAPGSASDTWAGYPDARRRAANLIEDAGMADRLVMVSGDAHMVALDDGSHTGYATAGVGGFPLLQAAALDRPGSVKGGPYSGGTFPGSGQFGEVEVDDLGGPTIDVTLRGLDWKEATLVEQTFTLSVGRER